MEDLKGLIARGDATAIAKVMREHGLVLKDGKIVPKNAQRKKELEERSSFFQQRQQARKILL